MSLLKVNEVQNYNGSSLTLTASTVSTSAQFNTGGNISVTGSINVSDDSTTRSNLGLGSISTQAADNVAITGGNISNATLASSVAFPAGHIIESKSTSNSNYTTFTNNTFTAITGFNQPITVKSSNSKMLVFVFLSGSGAETSNTSLNVNLTEATTSLDVVLTEVSGFTGDNSKGFDQTTLFYEHDHNQTAGTSLTYTPKFRSSLNTSKAFVNNFMHSAGNAHSVILVQELMQ